MYYVNLVQFYQLNLVNVVSAILVQLPLDWNSLPSDLHDLIDTKIYRKWLNSVIFNRAYS